MWYFLKISFRHHQLLSCGNSGSDGCIYSLTTLTLFGKVSLFSVFSVSNLKFEFVILHFSRFKYDTDHNLCISDVFSLFWEANHTLIWVQPSSWLYFWSIWNLIMTLFSFRRCFQIYFSYISCIWQQVLGYLFHSWMSIWHRTPRSFARSWSILKPII